MAQGTVLMTASHQWATRPDDERFVSLDDLERSVRDRKDRAVEAVAPLRSMRVTYDRAGELYLANPSGDPFAAFTNWSASQVAGLVGAPIGYLRKLPAPIAAMNLQYGLEGSDRAGKAYIVTGNEQEPTEFRALNGEQYGRIFDLEVVQQVKRVNSDGRWEIPAASYTSRDPKRATTLYASKHDVFIFLVDPNNAIEVAGEVLYRGFITWNSETGARTFGLMTFLYRTVCDNRMIWGAQNVTQLNIRHTRLAPDKFAWQAAPALREYANSGTTEIIRTVQEAKKLTVGSKVEDVESWLTSRGFTDGVAKSAVKLAEAEEGDPTSLWNVVQGLTAHARAIKFADDRVDLERRAGKLLDLVSA